MPSACSRAQLYQEVEHAVQGFPPSLLREGFVSVKLRNPVAWSHATLETSPPFTFQTTPPLDGSREIYGWLLVPPAPHTVRVAYRRKQRSLESRGVNTMTAV